MKAWTFWRIFRYVSLSVVIIFLLIQMFFFVRVWQLRQGSISETAFTRAESKRLCTQENMHPKCPITIQWVNYDQVSNRLKRAIIASEDSGFNDHNGIEVDAMTRAWKLNQEKGRAKFGGSTITQQLAKNMFLSSQRSYLRKGQELIIAFFMEMLLDKQRIFELYINAAEWGVGVFGIQSASLYYYGIEAKNLDTQQAAELASALPSPKCFDDKSYCAAGMRRYFARKKRIILEGMRVAELPKDELGQLIKKHQK